MTDPEKLVCNSFVGRHHQVKQKLWPTSARALHKTLRHRGRFRVADGILFARMRITIYYFLSQLLDRAALSHIQSELAAGTQIHYNTKCAV